MGHDGVRHLVWDWNGTLFDDHAAVVAAINDALALVRLGPIDSETFRSHYTRPVERFYEQVAGRPIEPAEWRTLDERYHLSYGASVERLVTFYVASGRADQAAVWRSRLSGLTATSGAGTPAVR